MNCYVLSDDDAGVLCVFDNIPSSSQIHEFARTPLSEVEVKVLLADFEVYAEEGFYSIKEVPLVYGNDL